MFDVVRKSAEKTLQAWDGLPIAYDNVNFNSQAQSEWCRVTVLNGASFESALGSNCVRHTGLVVIQIYTAQDRGSARARLLADEISALYKGLVDNGVTYRAGSLARVGHESDFYQLNLSIPWVLDET